MASDCSCLFTLILDHSWITGSHKLLPLSLYNKEIFNSRSTMWLKNPFNYVWNENIKNLNNIRTMLYRPICYVYHPPFFSSKIPRLKSVIDLYKGSGLQRRLISVIAFELIRPENYSALCKSGLKQMRP
jgi:hypothetical protein